MAADIFNQLILAATAASVYCLSLSIYRLFFSSLSRFPGPKIAAVTSLYAYYHDVIRGGLYIWVIDDMHKRYGPIVRIRPDVIHINDPEYIDQVYAGAGKRRDKYKIAVGGFATPGAALGTPGHDLHRSRRAAMNPYFSKQSIRRVEPMIQRTLAKVLGRLDQNAKSGIPMKMNILYSATTGDIITEYAFGESSHNLDREDLNEPYFTAFDEAGKGFHFASHVPIFVPIISTIPTRLALFLKPAIEVFLILIKKLETQIDGVRNSIEIAENAQTTIFHGLIANPNLPESEKTTARLIDEARVLLAAGTDTTASTVSAITYHLLANPKILRRLKVELEEAMPNPETMPTSLKVEALPYLTAVIQEGIRLHPGASIRQERVAPDEDLFYQDRKSGKKYMIPKGTAIAMTAPLLSRNEEIWPQSKEFRPERFLENPHLDKYLLTFSRGTRRCIGIYLAYSELYLVLAGIFRKYDLYDGTGQQKVPTLELFETSREDVDMASDHVTPMIKEGSKGVRVLVRE